MLTEEVDSASESDVDVDTESLEEEIPVDDYDSDENIEDDEHNMLLGFQRNKDGGRAGHLHSPNYSPPVNSYDCDSTDGEYGDEEEIAELFNPRHQNDKHSHFQSQQVEFREVHNVVDSGDGKLSKRFVILSFLFIQQSLSYFTFPLGDKMMRIKQVAIVKENRALSCGLPNRSPRAISSSWKVAFSTFSNPLHWTLHF